jgi:Co/Zn/Cd efflux system component
MEGTPSDVDLTLLTLDMKTVPSVMNVHDLHIWAMAPQKYILTAHVDVSSNDNDRIIADLQEICIKYDIDHITIQVE